MSVRKKKLLCVFDTYQMKMDTNSWYCGSLLDLPEENDLGHSSVPLFELFS